VGKTTVIAAVLERAKSTCTLAFSSDVARTLVRQGIRINTESQTEDYLAFLTVRFEEMLTLRAGLVMHERTLLDVLAFMELNGHNDGWLKKLTEALVRWQMSRLTLYFYLPIEFEAAGDDVRIVDPAVNRHFDNILVAMLQDFRPDFVRVAGTVEQRAAVVLEALDRVGLGLS
jgi:predicted ATPase